MKGRGRGGLREVVWSNKGWYQRSEFKGQQGFGYESRRSTATSDLLPEAPVGRSAVIVFIFLPNSPWPPLSSICITSIYFITTTLCTYTALFLLSSLYSHSVVPVHSWPEQSHRFIGRTWPYCVRMRGWEREKWGRVLASEPLGRHWKAKSGPEVNMEDRGQGHQHGTNFLCIAGHLYCGSKGFHTDLRAISHPL